MKYSLKLLMAVFSILFHAAACMANDSEPIRSFSIEADRIAVSPGASISLRASSGPVTWSINGIENGNELVGTIDEGGTYVAPASAPQLTTVKVTATLKKDDNVSASLSLRLLPQPSSPSLQSAQERVNSEECYLQNNTCSHIQPTHCPSRPGDKPKCTLTNFDRLRGETGRIGRFNVGEIGSDLDDAKAVAGSMALSFGTLLSMDYPDGVKAENCSNYDWKFVVQAKETKNIVVYGPADVGAGMCGPTPENSNLTGSEMSSSGPKNKYRIALPVHALWVDVFVYRQSLDPVRMGPGTTGDPLKDCTGQKIDKSPTIVPCDKTGHNPLQLFYVRPVASLLNYVTAPGSAVANIQFTPSASLDYQAETSFWVKKGWLSFPLTYERNSSQGSNLDSLIFGLGYQYRATQRSKLAGDLKHVVIRFPEFQVRLTPEFATSRSPEMGASRPHDSNLVAGEFIKLPFAFPIYGQPSALTLLPQIGVEEGTHLETHFSEQDSILRVVPGLEANFRIPYKLAHNFLGPSPITISSVYKVRYLLNAEPTAQASDVVSKIASTDHLSTRRRPYFNVSLNFPVTSSFALTPAVSGGALPPDFRVVHFTYTLGFTINTPGAAER